MKNNNIETLIDLIEYWAKKKPEEVLYTFLSNTKDKGSSLTYSELRHKSMRLAGYIQSIIVDPPARALLLISPGLEYIVAFFGCLYAGVTPVPLYPPQMNTSLQRLDAVILDSMAEIIIADSASQKAIEEYKGSLIQLKKAHLVIIDQLDYLTAEPFKAVHVKDTDPAFLQYTSGSTSSPKGVILTHKNLIHNSEHIYICFGHSENSKGVIWLPPYHDMGLIGGILQPLYGGFPVVLMSPKTFIGNPMFWLEAISKYRATTSGGNNFAYDLCLQRVTESIIEKLDLSSWTTAFNGAEPVRVETIKQFSKVFASSGFNSSAFYPCYGLAEATLIVSGRKRSDPVNIHHIDKEQLEYSKVVSNKENGRAYVSNGVSLYDQEIFIVDPETQKLCDQDKIGEIWVKGASVAQGYWKKEELTQTTFHSFIKDTGVGPCMRTGDLGYFYRNELYITGRLKDLIIIRGRNYYANDIEAVVRKAHPSLSLYPSAVFSVEKNGEEKLIVTQEVKNKSNQDWSEIIDLIRKDIMEEFQVRPYDIVLIPRKSIVKTSSGKISRVFSKKAYLENRMIIIAREISENLGHKTNSSKIEKITERASIIKAIDNSAMSAEEKKSIVAVYVEEIAASILNIPKEHIDISHPLLHYGLDSMQAVELQHKVETDFNVTLTLHSILAGSSINHIAEEIVSSKTTDVPVLVMEGNASTMPLSYGQQGLMYLQRLVPHNSAYNLFYAVNLLQYAEPNILKTTFQLLTERHALLRASFVLQNGKTVQSIADKTEPDFELLDVSEFTKDELDHKIEEDAHKAFDLSNDILFRIRLYEGFEKKQILLLVIHHIIADFWSFSVLFHDIASIYTRLVKDKLPELSMQKYHYHHYIEEQIRYYSSDKGREDLDFWKKELKSPLPVTELPHDNARTSIQSFEGATVNFVIEPQIYDEVQKISRNIGVTMYMTLLASFYIFLYRMTGQQDLIIGTPTLGRQKTEYSETVGYFVNPVAIRTELDKNEGFIDTVKRVGGKVIQVLERKSFPFPLLREHLDISNMPNIPTIFQVMFSYQQIPKKNGIDLVPFALNQSDTKIVAGSLEVELWQVKNHTAQFDLNLQMGKSEGRLLAFFQYNTKLFRNDTIERMIVNFKCLLEELTKSPDLPLRQIRGISMPEYQKVVYDWNQTEKLLPEDVTIPVLFEKQVELHRNREAVIFNNNYYTYGELNDKVNRWAHYLKTLGVGIETPVGIMLHRSENLIIILLAVMKAGGAYVTLNPSFPKNRIELILNDFQGKMIITQEQYIHIFKDYTGILIDAEKADVSSYSVHNPETAGNGSNLAYILYTSGTTGKPKGVMIEQKNIINFMIGMDDIIGVYDVTTVTGLNNIAFDMSTVDLWWSLTRGYKTLFFSEHSVLDDNGKDFFVQAERHKPEILNCTPTLLRHILKAKDSLIKLKSVHSFILGGEMLSIELVRKIKYNSDARILNVCGPTETTVYSAYYEADINDRSYIPIGRPIANNRIYILDEELRPCPIGVKGELYIGGAGLFRGYFNRPDLTSKALIYHQFLGMDKERLYKTGDIGFFLADGAIVLTGRNDFQIKIRGHRIELGDIESYVLKHEAIKDCVVTAYDVGSKEMRLVAYIIVQAEHSTPSVTELRKFLSSDLPEYMLPSFIVKVEQIPWTLNGKLDYELLPPPVLNTKTDTFVKPQGHYEEQIEQIWQTVLNRNKIGLYDNFFDLGGHSLLLPELQDMINQQFNIDIAIHIFFEYTTIYDLARYIAEIGKDEKPEGVNQSLNRSIKQREARQRRIRPITSEKGD